MEKSRALVIDDEPDIRELLQMTLERMDITTDVVENVTEAKAKLDSTAYNLCLTDLKLPDGNGIELVDHIQTTQSYLPVAVITAHGNMDTAVEAMKAGAFDFITKPIDLKNLRSIVSTAIVTSEMEEEPENDTPILGRSSSVQALIKSIRKVAKSQAPVFISGESGSGKELVARSIHELGPRKSGPFIPVNCGAIPKELMESEFFGHKKGAFTGATSEKAGLFQAAKNGTLFLDEVADLSMDMQVKLLRAIQEKAVRPVGAHQEISTDVRVLSATHKNLEDLVHGGDFRQDLFYRINVIKIPVPPLRDRREDVGLLSEHILKKLASQQGMPLASLSSKAIEILERYAFPGNIRELENILERAYTLCETQVIDIEDLELNHQESSSRPAASKNHHYSNCLTYPSIDDYLIEIEKEILCEALENVKWNKTMAAKKLGISFRSLRYRLSKLGLGEDQEGE